MSGPARRQKPAKTWNRPRLRLYAQNAAWHPSRTLIETFPPEAARSSLSYRQRNDQVTLSLIPALRSSSLLFNDFITPHERRNTERNITNCAGGSRRRR